MTDYKHPYNALPQGYRFEEYEFSSVLGSGTFGITYLCTDYNLKKLVAIKEYLPSDTAIRRTDDHSVVPKADQDREDFDWELEQFVNEAQTLARFDHRHVIKVHRYFEAHGTAYIVMEYAEGETLAKFLGCKEKLTEAELKEILCPLLNGLEEVHEAGILHRDIKPANIVIRAEDGSPVLVDFGAARQAIGERSHSLRRILTPGYAPFEQYLGRGHQGAWTDIYALGAVCYRALTGEVPVESPDRKEGYPLVPVSQRCANQASASFLSAIDGALSVDERDRPQTVAAWREMLEREERPPDPPIPNPIPNPRLWTQGATIAVLVGVLVLGSLGVWYIFPDRPDNGGIFNELEELKRYEKARDAAVDADDPKPLQDFVDRNPDSPYVSRADSLIQVWGERAD